MCPKYSHAKKKKNGKKSYTTFSLFSPQRGPQSSVVRSKFFLTQAFDVDD